MNELKITLHRTHLTYFFDIFDVFFCDHLENEIDEKEKKIFIEFCGSEWMNGRDKHYYYFLLTVLCWMMTILLLIFFLSQISLAHI